MSYSNICFNLPQETKSLPSYSEAKKFLQLWCWATRESAKFHKITLADCQGPNILAVKIFEGSYCIQEFGIRDAKGTHNYTISDDLEEFSLSLKGESSFGDDFELDFCIKVKASVVTQQKIEVVTKKKLNLGLVLNQTNRL